MAIRRLRLTPCQWFWVKPLELGVTGIIANWMRSRGWGGVTIPLPFFTVILYWLLDGEARPTRRLRLHEHVHFRQAIEMGFFGFWLLYLWDLPLGRSRHPMELEAARVTEADAEKWKEWL